MADEYTIPEPKEEGAGKNATSLDVPTMHLKVYSPYKVYFDGEALSVSAESATGPFDILPKHHNFITLLEPCDVIVRTSRGDQTIRISGGMMHVKADDVVVFLDV
jgi:F0F1-type ATP synthase epsilon subunit